MAGKWTDSPVWRCMMKPRWCWRKCTEAPVHELFSCWQKCPLCFSELINTKPRISMPAHPWTPISQVFEIHTGVEMPPILVPWSASLNALKRKTFDTASKIPREKKMEKVKNEMVKIAWYYPTWNKKGGPAKLSSAAPELQMLSLWHYLDEHAVLLAS